MSRERRGFARLYVGIEAAYQQEGKDNGQNTVLVQDISVSGVRFISNEVLKVDTILSFTLNIPDIKFPITASGKVVWQRKFSDSFYDTGIEFTQMPTELRQTLSNYIQQILGRVQENRQFVRCNLSTMISYRLANFPDLVSRGITVDISPTGLKIILKQRLEKGEKLKFEFTLPDESVPIFAEGTIIWCQVTSDNFYECGIEFTAIDDSQLELIDSYIKKTLGIDW